MTEAEKQTELARHLWALGDQTRLSILKLLPEEANCTSRNNVSQLAEKLSLSQPTVSHHLRVLRQSGFVDFSKMCRDTFYWRKRDVIIGLSMELIQFLESAESASDPKQSI